MSVLKDVKVLDFTQGYPGSFCTLQLADFGAEVFKIERKNIGDTARYWDPIVGENSGYFAAVNRNKKSLAIDYSTEEGYNAIIKMVEDADIIVENFKPGVMKKIGFDYDTVQKINPNIIYASLSGYGQTGPMKSFPAYDNVIQSMSGIMDMTGFPEDRPTKAGPSISDSLSAINTTLGILMAFLHKQNTGQGQYIDVAMLDSVVSIMEAPILFKSMHNMDITRCGNNDAATLVPYDVYECKDGYFSAGLAGESGWDRFCKVIERPDLIEHEKYCTNELRCQNFAELDPMIKAFMLGKTKDELGQLFSEQKIPNAPVLSIPEAMNHEQIEDREMMVEIDDHTIGKYRAIGNPMKLEKTPATYKKGASKLGEDSVEILSSFSFTQEEIEVLKEKEII